MHWRRLKPLRENAQIQISEVPGGYPSGSEKQLIHFLTTIEIPANKIPKEFGLVMFNVGTTYAVYDAIVNNKPMISRIVTLTGSGLSKPSNLEVKIGMPIEFLVNSSDKKSLRIVQGGNLMGITVNNTQAPVTKVTNCYG